MIKPSESGRCKSSDGPFKKVARPKRSEDVHRIRALSHESFWTINIAGVYVIGIIVNISPIWKVDILKSSSLVEKIGSSCVSVKNATVPQRQAKRSCLLHRRLQFVIVLFLIVLIRDNWEADRQVLSLS